MFTKAQMFERIKSTTDQAVTNTKQVIEHINEMDDLEAMVLAEAVTFTGAGIADALTNIALVLCEALLKGD